MSRRAFTLRAKLDHVNACQQSYGGSVPAYLAALEVEQAAGRFTLEVPVDRVLGRWIRKKEELERELAEKGAVCLDVRSVILHYHHHNTAFGDLSRYTC
jgi:hypothetical protein